MSVSYFLLGVCILFWLPWYWRLIRVSRIGASLGPRALLAVTPPLCGALLWEVLVNFAAGDVRQDSVYLPLYFAAGGVWVRGAVGLSSFLGVSVRDDVLERRSLPAGFAVCGALVGFTLTFAGGNVGNGPGEEAVVFSSFLSTAGLAVCWAAVERLTRVSELITIDRDPAAGLRLAGFLIAEGLVLGRAVAGDWVSLQATVRDFGEYALPALVPLALMWLFHKSCQPSQEEPASPLVLCGVLPCLVLVVGGAVWLVVAGAPK